MTDTCSIKAMVYMDQRNLYDDFKSINYSKILSYISDQYNVIRATSYYAIDTATKEDNEFILNLIRCGWKCETNISSISTNGIIITNLMGDKTNFDHKAVVVLSGDRELDYTLDMLAKYGYIIHVIGCKDKISINLMKVADKITFLEDIDGVITRKNKCAKR